MGKLQVNLLGASFSVKSSEDDKYLSELLSDYKDVIDYVKIVTNDEIVANGNSLAINSYIEKKGEEVIPPEEVRKKFFEALNDVKEAEAKMLKLLEEGGYLDEQN